MNIPTQLHKSSSFKTILMASLGQKVYHDCADKTKIWAIGAGLPNLSKVGYEQLWYQIWNLHRAVHYIKPALTKISKLL